MQNRLFAILLCISLVALHGKAQEIALKTNVLADVAYPAPNLAAEFSL